ncbi:MBL fold metallo-hydrolase [Pokkaliibacter sp. CJK22405]|uniref:MBL fold metallo-hydrolase n=1 Tax=Pokkaliibacter sp. CJK22405 TaxID=3384615 RepID=UPI0039849693
MWGGSLLGAVAVLGAGVVGYLQLPKFGAIADQAVLSQSSHYQNGAFQNLEPMPVSTLAEGEERKGWTDMLFSDGNRVPDHALPFEKTDLHSLDPTQDLVVWLGHSSFFIQLAGKRLLIDPVLSQNASPVPMTITAFPGTSPYQPEDIPAVDYLLISHDHWDHLDYPTLTALKDKIGMAIMGVGVGAHFRRWGFAEEQLREQDWDSSVALDNGLKIHVLPARHFSGRLFDRNQSLWVSYALETPSRRIYFSGDSGYGSHFKRIGDQYGPFDLVMLDSGQYNQQWRYVHMMPEDSVQAADDLRAKAYMPAHVGRFSLAFHSWADPFQRVTSASANHPWQLVTPEMGSVMALDNPVGASQQWWLTGNQESL